jgi:hypothetical protein
MCNKCESVTATQSAPLLTLWVEWHKTNNVTIRNAYRMRDAKQLIQSNINAGNANQHWWLNSRKYHNGDHRQNQIRGHELAELIATIYKNELASRDATTTQDFEPLNMYLRALANRGHYFTNKLEPMAVVANNNFANGVWEELDVMGKLHPYVTSNDVDFASYQKSHTAFHECNRLHRLHISKEDVNQIAYYPTLKHMREGREVRTRLGRYLTKYQNAFGLTDSQVKSMAEKHTSNMRSRNGWSVEFIEGNNAQGWVDIYDSDDVQSCMRGESAVRVYAHEKSVLRLAYVTSGDDKVIARCIVRDDDKKGWIRVYPDPNGCAEGRFLMDYLKSNDYPNRTNLNDVLLRHIDTSSGIVCPYIDSGENGDQSVSVESRDGKMYLVVGGGEFSATETDGYVNSHQCTCDNCGDSVDEDDLTYIEHDERSVCDHCRGHNYTYAYGRRYEDYFPEDECIEVNGAWYWVDTIHHHDIYECEYDGEYYHIDDLVHTPNGMYHVDRVTRVDHFTDCEYVYEDKAHTLSDGTTCHEDDADHYQMEIDDVTVEA